MPWLERTRLLLGEKALIKLENSSVYIIGLGAVGSYATEALARAGIGKLRLVDFDQVKSSNINRQLYAVNSTISKNKTQIAKARVLDINPKCQIEVVNEFLHQENVYKILSPKPDLVLDAIDSLNPKVELISTAVNLNIPIISAMGAATRLDPSLIKYGDIFSVHNCPLARQIRRLLRKKGITNNVPVIYSSEPRLLSAVKKASPDNPGDTNDYIRGRPRDTLGSISTITGIFGLWLAHKAIETLINK